MNDWYNVAIKLIVILGPVFAAFGVLFYLLALSMRKLVLQLRAENHTTQHGDSA